MYYFSNYDIDNYICPSEQFVGKNSCLGKHQSLKSEAFHKTIFLSIAVLLLQTCLNFCKFITCTDFFLEKKSGTTLIVTLFSGYHLSDQALPH